MQAARPRAVEIKSSAPPDDLVWPTWALPDDDHAAVPVGKLPTLHEQYPGYVSTNPAYPWTDWEGQRYERLVDYIMTEAGVTDPAAEHALDSMIYQEMHSRKIINAIKRQFR